jgi:ribosomal protein L23
MNYYNKIPLKLVNKFTVLKYKIFCSDKTTIMLNENKYTFLVFKLFNKQIIKKFFEYIFKLTIVKINSLNVKSSKFKQKFIKRIIVTIKTK